MRQVLVYGDSLSWGVIPGTRKRFPFHQRWPGILELELQRRKLSIRVMEDCLNGRRTVLEDPVQPGRNGRHGLAQSVESHSPLELVMIMLGVNDFQTGHNFTASDSAQGLRTLVDEVRAAPLEPGMRSPQVMLVAPPPLRTAKGPLAAKFIGAETKSLGLSHHIRRVADTCECAFFDAATATATSLVDGVHLDAPQHRALGLALAEVVAAYLGNSDKASA